MKQFLGASELRLRSFKLLSVLAFSLNMLLVIMKLGGLRVDIEVVQAISFSLLLLAGICSWKLKDSYSLHFALTLIASVFVFIMSAFVFTLTSPILAMNAIVIAAAGLLLRPAHSAVATLIVMNGPVAGFILIEFYDQSLLAGLYMHILALLALFVSTLVYGRLKADALDQANEEADTQSTERKRLEALINSMTDGVIATNMDGEVSIYNGSALDIINSNASLDGRKITDFLNIIDMREEPVDIVELAKKRGGYLVDRDLRLVLSENDKMNLFVNISPVKDGFGNMQGEGLIMLLRDITREKSLEEERNEFISVVSHELRTPITITEGNVSNALMVAKKEGSSELMQNMLNDAHKQVVFLADMMNDLSTLSRAERGKLQVKPEDINVPELVSNLQRDYKASAEHKGLSLNTDIDKNLSSLFNSKLYVREVLQNFLTNSIKYTQEGSVTLSAKQDGNTVVFAVTDTGIGISASDQKLLFDKFFRSEDFRTRENSGTGIGLYVTMKLTKLINATINVESELNKGSVFTVTVPSYEPQSDEETTS